jgi:hypothetical protein
MNTNFWTVFKADVLWSACLITFAVLAQVGVKLLPGYWRRYVARRKVAQALRYVAPEIFDARKYELEIEYGLRPKPIMGFGNIGDPPVFKDARCPHCGALVNAIVSLTAPVSIPPGELVPNQMGDPDQSGAYPAMAEWHKCACELCSVRIALNRTYCSVCVEDPGGCHG